MCTINRDKRKVPPTDKTVATIKEISAGIQMPRGGLEALGAGSWVEEIGMGNDASLLIRQIIG